MKYFLLSLIDELELQYYHIPSCLILLHILHIAE